MAALGRGSVTVFRPTSVPMLQGDIIVVVVVVVVVVICIINLNGLVFVDLNADELIVVRFCDSNAVCH